MKRWRVFDGLSNESGVPVTIRRSNQEVSRDQNSSTTDEAGTS